MNEDLAQDLLIKVSQNGKILIDDITKKALKPLAHRTCLIKIRHVQVGHRGLRASLIATKNKIGHFDFTLI